MIKTENGIIQLRGTKASLFADLGVIIKHMVTENIVTQDEVHDLTNIATMTNEEIDQYFENKLEEKHIAIDSTKEPEELDSEETRDFIEILEILNRMIDRRLK